MDARDAAARQVGGDDAITTRMGAVALPIGVVLIAISEVFHPSREDPMDFPAVFRSRFDNPQQLTVPDNERWIRLACFEPTVEAAPAGVTETLRQALDPLHDGSQETIRGLVVATRF